MPVKTSHSSNTRLLIYAIGFVVAGTLMAWIPEKFTTTRMTSAGFIRIAGIVVAVFFGLCALFIARQIIKNDGSDAENER